MTEPAPDDGDFLESYEQADPRRGDCQLCGENFPELTEEGFCDACDEEFIAPASGAEP